MNKAFKLIAIIVFLQHYLLNAQSSPGYAAFTGTLQGVGTTGTNVATSSHINFSVTDKAFAQTARLRQKNKSAKLYMKLDLGNDYIKQATGWGFIIKVDFNYQFQTSPASLAIAKTLTINTANPEVLKIDDVLPYFTTSSPALNTSITAISITDQANAVIPAGLLKDFIDKNVRLTFTLAREYDVDVRLASTLLMSNEPIAKPVSINNRLVTFTWQPGNVDAYPNYELQVLKLNNTADDYKDDQDLLATKVDWSNALKVETQWHTPSIKLTMAEGTGIYIWRVRPVGTYFNGSVANSENYGQWSYSIPAGTTTTLSINVINQQAVTYPYAFYFRDPDEKINWIYNRVFTEGDTYDKANPTGVKASEGMNYADGLQRVRQNQKYNSSENTKIVSQTINDYNGRPALTTMPVPMAGGLSGYTYSLVTNSLGELYTAKAFDEDNNINDPGTVSSAPGSPYAYYSGTVSALSNVNVASAEGYPFKRTVYTTDGTSRVAEESGVGKTHALGTQSNDRGRTTRILYSAPTDDELIRIFGDEAPLAESVIKTITIDQNNVMSVTYTSKEGKTIATALTSENTNNLSALTRVASTLTVTNSIDQNVNADDKIVSSKRIAVTGTNTPLTLQYRNESVPADGSGCASGKCSFRMRIYIQDLTRGLLYVSDADNNTAGNQDFNINAVGTSFPAGSRFVRTSTNTNTMAPTTISIGGINNNQVVLNSGEYMFTKEIYSGNSGAYADSIVNAVNDRTKPILDAIAARMQQVNSAETYTAFTAFTASLSSLINTYATGGAVTTNSLLTFLGIDPLELPAGYAFPTDFRLPAIETSTTDASTSIMQISTGCCGTISVQIPKLPFCVLCEGLPDSKYQTTTLITAMTASNTAALNSDLITPYGFNDFKNNAGWATTRPADKLIAINSLVESEFIIPLKNAMNEASVSASDLWKMAPGFSFESLNFMFSNMLISQYHTGSSIYHGSSWYAAAPGSASGYSLGASPLEFTNNNYAYNYDCKKLSEAWAGALATINSFEVAGNTNLINEFNDQDGQNSAQDNANDEDNWEDMSKRQKRKIKKALGEQLDDFGNSPEGTVTSARQEALTNIISTFMDIAGYQFAAIIDGDVLPSHISSTSPHVYPDDYFDFTGTVSGIGNGIYLTASEINGGSAKTYTSAPYLFQIDPTVGILPTTFTCNGSVVKELYYPYILRPEWMFKYFVYNVYENDSHTGTIDFIDDDKALIPHQVMIDIQQHYNAPASYLSPTVTPVPLLCSTPPADTYSTGSSTAAFSYYHKNWTAAERFNFYKSAKGAPKCFVNKGIAAGDNYYVDPTTDGLPTCEPKELLIQNAVAELTSRMEDCYEKKESIKYALTNELINACYNIVSCKSGSDDVTEKEIDLMAMAVIKTMTTQIAGIISSFTNIATITSTAPCNSPITVDNANSYSNDLCGLPACSEVACSEIILYNNNSIGLVDSRKLSVKYFSDCDKNILSMLESGTFLPNIAPARMPCTKAPKPWLAPGCGTNSNCGTNTTGMPIPFYEEKKNCGDAATFEKYSAEYSVQAGQ